MAEVKLLVRILIHHAFSAIIPGTLLLAITGFGHAEVARFVGSLRRRQAPK
jgi:hypothetical protein